MQKNYLIKASEINEFIYCRRCWWKNYVGLSETTAEMEAGSVKHNTLASNLAGFNAKKAAVIMLLLISFFSFVLLLLVKILFHL